jgi:DNA-binding MarR family transcriptional regulator
MDEKGKEDLGAIIKSLYERYEMLSRWTPELTAREFLAVLAMREGDSRSVSWLASALGCPMSSASYMADALARKKVLARRRSKDDRRVVQVKLTEKGREALEQYDRIFTRIAGDMSERLEGAEMDELVRLLGKLVSG